MVKRRALSKTDRERTPYAEAHGGRKLGGGAPAVVLGSTADDDGDAGHAFTWLARKDPMRTSDAVKRGEENYIYPVLS